jgi:hypothetical protein
MRRLPRNDLGAPRRPAGLPVGVVATICVGAIALSGCGGGGNSSGGSSPSGGGSSSQSGGFPAGAKAAVDQWLSERGIPAGQAKIWAHHYPGTSYLPPGSQDGYEICMIDGSGVLASQNEGPDGADLDFWLNGGSWQHEDRYTAFSRCDDRGTLVGTGP